MRSEGVNSGGHPVGVVVRIRNSLWANWATPWSAGAT